MLPKKYRSPTARTGPAAAAPARLAEASGGKALWRERPDGELEVATVKDGSLYVHLVYDDGTTTVIEEIPLPRVRHWFTRASYAGFGLCVASTLGMAVGSLSAPRGFGLALAGMAVMGIGVIAGLDETNVAIRLRRRDGSNVKWHEAAKLNGWRPQTSAQLTGVERLANAHKGVAYVKDVVGPSVEVRVKRWGRTERYWVDESGRADHAETAPRTVKDIHAVRSLIFPLFVVGVIVALGVPGSAKPLLLAGAILACVALVVVCVRLGGAPRTLNELEGGDRLWIEVRTIEEDTGG